MTDDTLTTLLAEREILQQMSNFCRALDRFDRELYIGLWHEDSMLENPGEQPANALSLTDFYMHDHANTEFFAHQFTNPTIRIKGDRAASESYLSALMRRTGEHEGEYVDTYVIGARFLDRWSKRKGRWAIDLRRIIPGARVTATVKGSTGPLNKRDATDPSYENFAWLDMAREDSN